MRTSHAAAEQTATSAAAIPADVPGHVAIIMDGNGRWATQRGRPRWMGHVRGAQTVREVVTHCARRGVSQLTLFAFSSDNWKRPPEEVGLLFDLFRAQLTRQLASLVENGIRFSMIGRRDRLPPELCDVATRVERATNAGRRMQLSVAIDYSSRMAIQTALAIGQGGRAGPAGPTILPTVDLLIRTGGERRLSDFLLWESAYAELAFLEALFPDLTTQDLDGVFADFASRERRYGGVGR